MRLCFLAMALAAASAANAACPAPQPGQPWPPEARAEFLENPPWRARVAAVDNEIASSDLSKVRILFLGDSITEAWDPAIFAERFARYGALNLGVRGDTTQGMLWRLPRIRLGTQLRPALIVLLIGTNNTWPGGNPESAAIGVAEVVRTLNRLSPGSKILLVGILPRGPDITDPWRRMGAQMNKLIAACADGRSVFYAEPGLGLSGPREELPTGIAADYLHPTPRGYAILADRLGDRIRQLLE